MTVYLKSGLFSLTVLSILVLFPSELASIDVGGGDLPSPTDALKKDNHRPTNCLVTVALAGAGVAELDGLCYDDKIADRVCCKNVAVLGSTRGTGKSGLVSVAKDLCAPHEYCCLAKANAANLGQNTVLC